MSLPPPSPVHLRIGVFDSGVGGLSVLQALQQALPQARFLYAADAGHAPYGERTDEFIVARSVAIARFLLEQGAQMLVIACNTATAAAVAALRSLHPDLPIVGVEPGLKPAVAATRNGRIGVMATTSTLRSQRFQRLMDAHGAGVHVHLQACPGLAHAIEAGALDSPNLLERVRAHCAPLREQGVDTVVLGCTHYPFAAPLIQAELGAGVALVDTAEAVARRSASLAAAVTPSAPAPEPGLELWTSGEPERLQRVAELWLHHRGVARKLPSTV